MSSDNITIQTELQEPLSLFNTRALQQTLLDLNLSKGVIYYIITDDELLLVNREHLKHDYYTDIITFDYGADEDYEEHEILISWDRIKDNATIHNQTLHRELHRVCIHGLLHIAGYQDGTYIEKQKMRSQENRYLDLYCST